MLILAFFDFFKNFFPFDYVFESLFSSGFFVVLKIVFFPFKGRFYCPLKFFDKKQTNDNEKCLLSRHFDLKWFIIFLFKFKNQSLSMIIFIIFIFFIDVLSYFSFARNLLGFHNFVKKF
jgi:hypothetical protein